MPKAPRSAIITPNTAEAGGTNPATLLALESHAVCLELKGAYDLLLKRTVFCQKSLRDKYILGHQKALLDYNSYQILQLLWKESSFITDAERDAFGMERSFINQSVTCWGLATRTATTPGDVGKVNKRIQTIVSAAHVYGLVELQRIGPKRTAIVGSQTLHNFMIELSQTSIAIADRLAPGLSRGQAR